MELGALQIGVLFGVVLLGAALQGAVGFGLGMLAAPVISIIAPQLLPGFVILLAVVLTASAALIERTSIDVRGAGWALVGRIPGSVGGTLLVAWLSDDALTIFVVVTVLLGVGISLRGWAPAATPSNVAIAGVVSGAMGTATGIGGPPMALVWQGSEPATYRATMSAYFLIGTLISLVMLIGGGPGLAGDRDLVCVCGSRGAARMGCLEDRCAANRSACGAPRRRHPLGGWCTHRARLRDCLRRLLLTVTPGQPGRSCPDDLETVSGSPRTPGPRPPPRSGCRRPVW